MDILISALNTLSNASEEDLRQVLRDVEPTKVYETANRLHLLSVESQSSTSHHPAGEFRERTTPAIAWKDTPSFLATKAPSTVVWNDTTPPSPPLSFSTRATARSDGNSAPPPPSSSSDSASDVPEADIPVTEFCLTRKDFIKTSTYINLLRNLDSLYVDIDKFIHREVKAAVGPFEQDYRLSDICHGTSAHANNPQAKFRATLAERSLALAFEQWELGQIEGLSRVQRLTKDPAAARTKEGRVRKFLLGLGFSRPELGTLSRAVHRGIKHLVTERLLNYYRKTATNNCEVTDAESREGIAGITAFASFEYREWQRIHYCDIPGLIFLLLLPEFSKLLELAERATPWIKNVQLYYDSQGQRQQESLDGEDASASSSHSSTTTVSSVRCTPSLPNSTPPTAPGQVTHNEHVQEHATTSSHSHSQPSTAPSFTSLSGTAASEGLGRKRPGAHDNAVGTKRPRKQAQHHPPVAAHGSLGNDLPCEDRHRNMLSESNIISERHTNIESFSFDQERNMIFDDTTPHSSQQTGLVQEQYDDTIIAGNFALLGDSPDSTWGYSGATNSTAFSNNGALLNIQPGDFSRFGNAGASLNIQPEDFPTFGNDGGSSNIHPENFTECGNDIATLNIPENFTFEQPWDLSTQGNIMLEGASHSGT